MPIDIRTAAPTSESPSTRRSTRPKRSSVTPKPKPGSSLVDAETSDFRSRNMDIGDRLSRRNAMITQSNPRPWMHPQELRYICEEDFPQDIVIRYLCSKAFSIPPREANTTIPLFHIKISDGTAIGLPRGYRVPLMFVAKFQWDSLQLVLTAADPQKDWEEHKFDLIHLSRLCQRLFVEASEAHKEAVAAGAKGIDRLWRSVTFDRVLTRFYQRWFVSREWSIRKFWEEYDDDEYDDDVLKHDWSRWAVKGYKGFMLSRDEVLKGITAQEFMHGLSRNSQGVWIWDSSLPPSSIGDSLPSSNQEHPITVEDEPNTNGTTIAQLEKVFDVHKVTGTPSHNTIEVKKERLELSSKGLPTVDNLKALVPSNLGSAPVMASNLPVVDSADRRLPHNNSTVIGNNSGAAERSKSPTVGQKRGRMMMTAQKTSSNYIFGIKRRKTSPNRPSEFRRYLVRNSSEDGEEGSSSSGSDDSDDSDYRSPRKSRAKAKATQIKSNSPRIDRASSSTLMKPWLGVADLFPLTNGKPDSPRTDKASKSTVAATQAKTKPSAPKIKKASSSAVAATQVNAKSNAPRTDKASSSSVAATHMNAKSDSSRVDKASSSTVVPAQMNAKPNTPRTDKVSNSTVVATQMNAESNAPRTDKASSSTHMNAISDSSRIDKVSSLIVVATQVNAKSNSTGINNASSSTNAKSDPTRIDKASSSTVAATQMDAKSDSPRVDKASSSTNTKFDFARTDKASSPTVAATQVNAKSDSPKIDEASNSAVIPEQTDLWDSRFVRWYKRQFVVDSLGFVRTCRKTAGVVLPTPMASFRPPCPLTIVTQSRAPLSSGVKAPISEGHGSTSTPSNSAEDGVRSRALPSSRDVVLFDKSSNSDSKDKLALIATLLGTVDRSALPLTVSEMSETIVDESGEDLVVLLQAADCGMDSSVSFQIVDTPVAGLERVSDQRSTLDSSNASADAGVSTNGTESLALTDGISKPHNGMDVDEPVPRNDRDEDLHKMLTSLLSDPRKIKVQRALLLLRDLLRDPRIHSSPTLTTIDDDERILAARHPLFSSIPQYTFAQEGEALTTEEHLQLVVKCSSLLSKYVTIYKGHELEQRMVELDMRLRQELSDLGIIQVVAIKSDLAGKRTPILVDKEVSTMDHSGLSSQGQGIVGDRQLETADSIMQDAATDTVATQSLTPEATMVDLSEPASSSSDSLKTELVSDSAPPTTRLMTSMMRNLADLLDCIYGGEGDDESGKGRALDTEMAGTVYDLTVVTPILNEFKSMKEELRKSQERSKKEIESMARLHRAELNSIKEQMRATEDKCQRETELLRQEHRKEMDSLLGSVREAEKKGEGKLPLLEMLELRRRVVALESRGPSNRSNCEDEPDIAIVRRAPFHPLGHLFDFEEAGSPVAYRLSPDGMSKPGTPIQSESSNAIFMDSTPLPIKSQRKFQSMHRLSLA